MAGGIDWFRWHHGSVTDPKFGLIAKKAGARIGDVIALWAYLLETASAEADRGCIGQLDFEAIDHMLDLEDGQAARILDTMTARGLIAGSRVSNWEKRQPKREDPTAADRKREQRQREHVLQMAGVVTQEQSRNVTQRHTEVTHSHDREEKSREEKKRVEKKDSFSVDVVGAADAAHHQPTKRASRLPDDWKLPKAWGDWAMQEFPHWTPDIVRLEGEKFADHFRGKAGKDGAKLDWQGTWRNWCRSDIAQRTHAPQRGRPVKPSQMTDDQLAQQRQTDAEKAARLLFGDDHFADVIDADVLELSHEQK